MEWRRSFPPCPPNTISLSKKWPAASKPPPARKVRSLSCDYIVCNTSCVIHMYYMHTMCVLSDRRKACRLGSHVMGVLTLVPRGLISPRTFPLSGKAPPPLIGAPQPIGDKQAWLQTSRAGCGQTQPLVYAYSSGRLRAIGAVLLWRSAAFGTYSEGCLAAFPAGSASTRKCLMCLITSPSSELDINKHSIPSSLQGEHARALKCTGLRM